MNGKVSLCAVLLFVSTAWLTAGCGENGLGLSNLRAGSAQSADGEWSILLTTFSGASHVSDASRSKQATAKCTGWKNLIVVHKADRSELLWGAYRSVAAAGTNLKKAKSFVSPAGYRSFAMAIVVPLPGEDIGPAELNLRNAAGAYSVLVAIFQNDPPNKYHQRKTDAVAYCKRLRKHGYEAYYYHSLVKSGVTVGSFPETAGRTARQDNVERVVVTHPGITAIKADPQFEFLAINGQKRRKWLVSRARIDPRTGRPARPQQDYLKPYVIHIPRKDSDGRDSPDRVGDPQLR